MRLRQVALVGRDLAAIRQDITEVLGLGGAYADPGVGKYGLANQVWPIGDTFLEVVSPTQDGTTAGRLLDKRGGDGGYMAIFQTDDLAADRARIAKAGVRVVDQMDRGGASFTHLHPKDVPGAIVSVDAMEPKERWEWGGPDWRDNVRTDSAVEIRGAEVQGEDPAAMSERWAQVLACPREQTADGWRLVTEGGEIRFTPLKDARGEGLTAFDVAVRDPAAVRARAKVRGCVDQAGEVVLCGTRVRLVQA
ncbi:VOC family protein [Phenylobacterium soli]|nr:VOC family protein [Phenylobacterium soli]